MWHVQDRPKKIKAASEPHMVLPVWQATKDNKSENIRKYTDLDFKKYTYEKIVYNRSEQNYVQKMYYNTIVPPLLLYRLICLDLCFISS